MRVRGIGEGRPSEAAALALLISGCATPPQPAPHPTESVIVPASGARGAAIDGARPPPPREAQEPAASPTPTLPAGVEPGAVVSVRIPDDRAAVVVHGFATTRRAIMYLHGVCGNIDAIRTWAEPASRFGTLIALRGDLRCDVPGRYRWNQDTALLDIRIQRALVAVAKARSGLLDTNPVAVIGYSQGATRAMALAHRFPERYVDVVLAGSPVAPRPDRLREANAIAVVGGEREPTDHMRRGFEDLVAAGKRARYFTLPGAGHGEYGPRGAEVMSSVLAFLFDPGA